jgi:hypothetical protein
LVVSTTTKSGYAQPALIGGVVMGVLSALPIVSGGNLCCCLWVVSGGAVAAYVLQQNQAAPIAPADGALVGLLAGLIGALVQFVVAIPIDILVGPTEMAMLHRILDNPSISPDARDMFQRFDRGGAAGGIFVVVLFRIIGLMLSVFVGGLFSTLGGLLGALIFRKQSPPGTIDVTA